MARSPALLLLLLSAAGSLLLGVNGAASRFNFDENGGRSLLAAANRPFPYCKCNSAPTSSPWRVALVSTAPLAAGQRVALSIGLDPSVPCTDGLNKIEFDTLSTTVSRLYRGAFRDAFLNERPFSSIQWETTRPIVKFTGLKLTCAQGEAGASLVFVITRNATLETICGSADTCRVAAFTPVGGAYSGPCPVSTFAPLVPSPPTFVSSTCKFADSNKTEFVDLDLSSITDCYACMLACRANSNCTYFKFESDPYAANWAFWGYGFCAVQPLCRWASDQPEEIPALDGSATCEACASGCAASPSCSMYSYDKLPWTNKTDAACADPAPVPEAACLWAGMTGGNVRPAPANASVSCEECQTACAADDAVDTCYQYKWQGSVWSYWDSPMCPPPAAPATP